VCTLCVYTVCVCVHCACVCVWGGGGDFDTQERWGMSSGTLTTSMCCSLQPCKSTKEKGRRESTVRVFASESKVSLPLQLATLVLARTSSAGWFKIYLRKGELPTPNGYDIMRPTGSTWTATSSLLKRQVAADSLILSFVVLLWFLFLFLLRVFVLAASNHHIHPHASTAIHIHTTIPPSHPPSIHPSHPALSSPSNID